MTGFTKGPWEVRGDENAPTVGVDVFFITSRVWGTIPADGKGDNNQRNKDERLANARLIAASPQLYEALAMADKVLAPFNGFAEINSWLAQVVEPALKAARGER